MNEARIYGVVAEFADPAAAVRAAREAKERGFARVEGYGPCPLPALARAAGFRERRIAPAVLGGGLLGALAGYGLQYYATVVAFPHNVGGRPLHSWPSFLPITFELGVLCATVSGITAFLLLNRFPRLAHPMFSVPGFERASRDRFFVCIRAEAGFNVEAAERTLAVAQPLAIHVAAEDEEDAP